MLKASGGAVPVHENPGPVLLVEDNPLNQKVASVLLERLGLIVEIAENGRLAVEAVGKKKYAVILMDCHMPEMDGFEATVEIRRLEAQQGHYTPIIAVTALAMAGDRERCIAAGMDDYLSKPIDRELLEAKLRRWLSSQVVYNSQKHTQKFLRSNSSLRVLESDPVNLEELEAFYGAEVLKQMMAIFINDTEDMLSRIETQRNERNVRAVAGLAHELKASAASIGAKQLARLSLYIEQAAGQQDWIEVAETLASFHRSFEYFKNFVQPVVEADQANLSSTILN